MNTTTPPSVLRTSHDIVNEIERIQNEDVFGIKTSDLIGYLDFEHAKPYLVPEATAEEWKVLPRGRESILEQMKEYMPFAWSKANDQRGLSAARSLMHYTVWTWMIGDEGRFGNLEQYQHYGKDNLRKICEAYGWDADAWDDGERVN